MVLYKLPRYMGVPPQDNKIPAFKLKIDFSEGALAEHSYISENSNDLWALIGASVSLEDKVFFEIVREDTDLKFQGYGKQKKFCLFQDSYQSEVKLMGSPSIDDSKLKLAQIWDMRWELTYFLPQSAFYNFETMVEIGTQSLQSGTIGKHVVFSQSFPDLGLPDGYC